MASRWGVWEVEKPAFFNSRFQKMLMKDFPEFIPKGAITRQKSLFKIVLAKLNTTEASG